VNNGEIAGTLDAIHAQLQPAIVQARFVLARCQESYAQMSAVHAQFADTNFLRQSQAALSCVRDATEAMKAALMEIANGDQNVTQLRSRVRGT
jgi:hypothetical protein